MVLRFAGDMVRTITFSEQVMKSAARRVPVAWVCLSAWGRDAAMEREFCVGVATFTFVKSLSLKAS